MKYRLDTDICIYLMKHQLPTVAHRFSECLQGDLVISAITLAELEAGVRVSGEATRHQNRQALDVLVEMIPSVAFDAPAAAMYAEVQSAVPDRR